MAYKSASRRKFPNGRTTRRSRDSAWQGRPGGLSGPVREALELNIPNLITLARILSVPIMVWAISSGEMLFAFILFVIAGLSDAVDGYLAKRLDMASELGAYLDPIADKALIVSIYVTLGISGAVPRDIMIVGAVMLAWLLGKPIAAKPLMVSKINTAAQIGFAGLVLAALGFDFDAGLALDVAMGVVAALTLLSIAAYVREWVRHMGSNGSLQKGR